MPYFTWVCEFQNMWQMYFASGYLEKCLCWPQPYIYKCMHAWNKHCTEFYFQVTAKGCSNWKEIEVKKINHENFRMHKGESLIILLSPDPPMPCLPPALHLLRMLLRSMVATFGQQYSATCWGYDSLLGLFRALLLTFTDMVAQGFPAHENQG